MSGNQVLGVGHNGAMTDHHALRTPGSACGVEHVCDAFGNSGRIEFLLQFIDDFLRGVLLHRGSHGTSDMDGEVVDDEADGWRSPEQYDLAPAVGIVG